jgi:hypothetical protein
MMQASEASKAHASNISILFGPTCDLSHSEKKWLNMFNHAKPYEKLIKKCWADESFKQRLLADPADLPEAVSDLVAGGYFIFSRGGFSFDFVIHNR